MPNSGSRDPTGPLGPIGSDRSEAIAPSDAATGAEGVARTRAAEGAASASAVGATTAEAIASALASGTIDAQTARMQLIDEAVRAHLPPDAAPETVSAIRAEVEALLAHDPLVERLLRP